MTNPVDPSLYPHLDPSIEWRPVEGYEGLYLVSEMGDVYGVRRKRCLSPAVNGDDYRLVQLYKNGHQAAKRVARLVALSFISNPENKPTVDHIDTIRTNDFAYNLRWATQKEQCNHPHTKLASARAHSKPVLQLTLQDQPLCAFWSAAQASRWTRVHGSSISACCLNRPRQSQAGGYHWRYATQEELEKYGVQ